MTMFAWPRTPYKEIHEISPAMTLDEYHAYELRRLEEWIRSSAARIKAVVNDGTCLPINAVFGFKNHIIAIISGRNKREEIDFYSEHLNALFEELATQIYPKWQPGLTERYRNLGNGWSVDDHYVIPGASLTN